MNQRKFSRINKEKEKLIMRIKILHKVIENKNETISKLSKRLLSERLLTKESDDQDERDEIYMLCNSYESGFGHGLANDGFDLSKTPHAQERFGIAYQIGYDAGQERYKQNNTEKEITCKNTNS